MHKAVKQYADSGNISKIRITFLSSLDVDPTFEEYKEDFEYCKNIPGVFEVHKELKPFELNSSKWNENYWISLKMDMNENFSLERFNHMREVAQVFYSDKINRLLEERKAAAEQKAAAERKAAEPKTASTHNSNKPIVSVDETPKIIESTIKKFSVEKEIPRPDTHNSNGGSKQSKKGMGIAIAIVAVLVVLLILILK